MYINVSCIYVDICETKEASVISKMRASSSIYNYDGSLFA